MNRSLICKMYKDGKSMRQIALEFGTNHKLISRMLKKENVEIRVSENLRGSKKFECDIERLYNNMATHLRFDIDYKWLMTFKDIDKLKTLNQAITNRNGRWNVDTEWYKSYILKFYNDKQFNDIYEKWVVSNYNKYKKPSIDHIIPKSKNGTNDITNLQFLTWFENRCKNNIPADEWEQIKSKINDYFI